MIKMVHIPYKDVILERDSRWTWKVLALQAGSLNIFGFLAAHHFVSHTTGFASNFALFFHNAELFESIVFLLLPLSFLAGSFVCGAFTEVRRKKNLSPLYFIPLLLTVVLLLQIYIAGLFDFWSPFGRVETDAKDIFILAILCFSMGMQNALFTTVSGGIIRTTHLTGLTTDLGIELAESLFLKKKIFSDRNRFRIGLIFFFMVGTLGGIYWYSYLKYHGLIINILIASTLSFYFFHKNIQSNGFNQD
jgi:uncharacterized membrane protein YoaK (UPF0700 family)